jgi:SSS family solute:Na+ symporter
MHHSAYSGVADHVNGILETMPTKALKSQLTVPLVLTQLLPPGLMGAFAAVILAAFISNHGTYLHSWGSIFIQDVIMPWRKQPFQPEQHIKVLRCSLTGVAVFIFIFSMLFRQADYIFLFFAVTAAIYAGGSGAVIIGGLYWKRGTTAAAWTAMISGSVTAVGGIIIQQLVPDFPINGQLFWGLAMLISTLLYIVVSLFGKKTTADMDQVLRRGMHSVNEETRIVSPVPERGLKMLGMGKEFTRGDRFIYVATYVWTFIWIAVFVVGSLYYLTQETGDAAWIKFWYVYLWINAIIAVIVVIWFSIGGIRDLRSMFKSLSTMERDHQDSGFVQKK